MGYTNSKIFDAVKFGRPPEYALKTIIWAKALYARTLITHPAELTDKEVTAVLMKLNELENGRVRNFNQGYTCPMCPESFRSKRELGRHKKTHVIKSLTEVKSVSWKGGLESERI